MTITRNSRPIEILLVEDSPGDVRLTQEALKEAKVRNNLTVARDGEEAMKLLKSNGAADSIPRPDLVLLDLNLPRKTGREVLEEVKGNPALRRIPVVILTTSNEERDVSGSYDLHANAYITKPVDLDQFIAVVVSIQDFWLEIVTLPPV